VADEGWAEVLEGWLGSLGIPWPRRRDPLWRRTRQSRVGGSFTTRALSRFVSALRTDPHPVILDLGPASGRTVSFLGLELSCKLIVSDLVQGLEDAEEAGERAQFIDSWMAQPPASVDGVLCWDLFDYLPPQDADALAAAVARILKPGGVAFAMFSTIRYEAAGSVRFAIDDVTRITYRPVPSSLRQRPVWLSRDVARLSGDLRVDEAYLLKHGMREVLLRKPRLRARSAGP
jgi:SAM-dependent methyltransferase